MVEWLCQQLTNELLETFCVSILIIVNTVSFVFYHTCTFTATTSGPTGGAGGQIIASVVGSVVGAVVTGIVSIIVAIITKIACCSPKSKYIFNCSYGNSEDI